MYNYVCLTRICNQLFKNKKEGACDTYYYLLVYKYIISEFH